MKHREEIDFDIIDRDEPEDDDLLTEESYEVQEANARHAEIMERLDSIDELLAKLTK